MSDSEQQDAKGFPKAIIVILVLGVLGMVAAGSDPRKGEAPTRASPDGSGWYKDTGLTNAQMIEIEEFCRENPDSFKCK